MNLKMDFSLTERPWYPTNAGRPLTDFEARMDLLIVCRQKGAVPGAEELSSRWAWPSDKVREFVALMRSTRFLEGDWYDEDHGAQRRAAAMEVIGIFNAVFERKVQLTESRIRMIYARIKEGKKMTPPIGPAQFKAVFEFKKKEWQGTEMEKYLNIETLCRPSHFMQYLEAAREDYKKEREKSFQVNKKEEGITIQGSLIK